MFSLAHVHLLVNHVPIIGSFFVTALFIVALIFKNVFLQKVSLWFLVVVALSTPIAYVSGDPTKRAVQGLPNVDYAAIAAHEIYARYGLILMFLIGVLALGGAVFYWKRPSLPVAYKAIITILLLISVVLFTYIGLLGGQIMHPEIRSFLLPLSM
jgi:uncharacterized membrane protein